MYTKYKEGLTTVLHTKTSCLFTTSAFRSYRTQSSFNLYKNENGNHVFSIFSLFHIILDRAELEKREEKKVKGTATFLNLIFPGFHLSHAKYMGAQWLESRGGGCGGGILATVVYIGCLSTIVRGGGQDEDKLSYY